MKRLVVLTTALVLLFSAPAWGAGVVGATGVVGAAWRTQSSPALPAPHVRVDQHHSPGGHGGKAPLPHKHPRH
jgi:hypothetical protein